MRLRSVAIRTVLALLLFPAGAPAGVQDTSLAERRARATALAAEPEATDLAEGLALLADADPRTRVQAAAYLGAVELEPGGDSTEGRHSALVQLAELDPVLDVRHAGLEALAEVGDAAAVEALASLARSLSPTGRVRAAQLLAGDLYLTSDAARERLELAVRGSFAEGAKALPDDVLAIWLPSYARRLAERDRGGDLALERAPIVLSLRDPAPHVRIAAEAALEVLLDRLRELERYERAERLLARLAEDGVATRPLLFARARGLLQEGGVSPTVALSGARRLAQSKGDDDPIEDATWRARAAQLEAGALLALERWDEAEEALERAADLYDGLIARRLDGHGERGAAMQRDALLARALVEFTVAFRLAAGGADGDDLTLLQRLRSAHVLQLRAQLVATDGSVGDLVGLELLLVSELSPYRLVFAFRPHEAWPAARALDLQGSLGRSLASISAREMPGFEPYDKLPGPLADPLGDPRRANLLAEIGRAELRALQKAYDRLSAERLKNFDSSRQLENELASLSFAMRRLRSDLADVPLAERFYDLRQPAATALQYAESLRNEGRHEASREVAERFVEALEEEELRQQYSWAVRLTAQAELSIGGSYSDAEEPAEAETHLLEALDLLEGLKTFFDERGAAGAARAVDNDIAEALVSLAVNANVKGKDPDKALGFFERAYAIRQDDFMRVLLACYRARSGQEAEARELIRGVPESPRAYYNLACTYALLGDVGEALRFLEKDFRANRTSAAALEKQKAWARSDPDLAALQGDPRFEVLTEPK